MKLNKLAAVVLSAAMAGSLLLTGCGGSGNGGSGTEGGSKVDASDISDYGINQNVKIGVLASDLSTAEALSFRAYYEEYLGSQYDVDFIYSEQLGNAEEEISAIEQFIAQGCQGIISLSSFDRPGQIDLCESAGIYYGVAAGVLTDEEQKAYEDCEHYVGAVGPSLETEYQTGYDMAKYFIDKGDTSFLIFAGAAAFGTEMHIYRVAGMFEAMCEADASTSYNGATEKDDIITAIYGDLGVNADHFSSDTFTVSAVNGYNMDDAWFGEIAEKINTPGLQAVLAVGNGSDFFGSMAPEGVEVGSVDTYAEGYLNAMENGQLDYMAGKFSPSIAPIFVAVINAINGVPLRSDGSAFMIDQGYWIATNADEFKTFLDSSSATNPVYDKEILDQYISTPENVVSYSDFESFVSAYTFDDIQNLK